VNDCGQLPQVAAVAVTVAVSPQLRHAADRARAPGKDREADNPSRPMGQSVVVNNDQERRQLAERLKSVEQNNDGHNASS
jgi:hypothetical protein